MRKISPGQVIFPLIAITTCLLIMISRSIYDSSFTHTSDEFDGSTAAVTQTINAAFPIEILKWEKEIILAASENQLDPNLIASVILLESGGQPQVISASGAVGLMQVMPRDGSASSFMCINGPCFKDRPTTTELLDPAFNIRFGANYLAGLIRREGDFRSALHAYGPMDVGFSYADKVLSILNSYS